MREKLIEYVKSLFREAPDNQHNRDLQEEILQNCLDRFDDLTAGGMPEDEAYRQTVSNLGDVRQLWEMNPPEQPVPTTTQSQYKPQTQPKPRRRMWWVAAAVAAVAIVAILAIVFLAGKRRFAFQDSRGFGSQRESAADWDDWDDWEDDLEERAENWADDVEDRVESWAGSLIGEHDFHDSHDSHSGHHSHDYGSACYTAGCFTPGGGEVAVGTLEKVEIDWLSGSVTVECWDGDTISLSERGADGETDHQLHWLTDDETLHIRCCGTKNCQHRSGKDLLVRLPEGIRLERLSVCTTSADGNIGPVEVEHLEFESTSGDASFTGTAKGLDCDTTSGDLRVSGTVSKKLSFSTVSGCGTLDLEATPEELSFDSTSGDMRVTIPGERSFEVELDTALSGGFHCDFPVTKEDEDSLCYDAAGSKDRAELEFDTISGDVEIRKR